MAKSNTEFPPGPASKVSPKLLRQLATDPIKTLDEFNRKYGDCSFRDRKRPNHWNLFLIRILKWIQVLHSIQKTV